MDRIEAQLIQVMQARLRVKPELTSKLTDLNLDSLKTADFLRELEDEFDVRFDQDVFELDTVAELAAYIRTHSAEVSAQR